jgi:hypothetical protein
MADIRIHQIYYSEQTRAGLDPGFIGLDNLRNERPDLREFWPIREFLRKATMEADAWYGFFSPKFRAKTSLDARAVVEFVAAQADNVDVVLFSPFFDQMAYPLNIFEQGAMQHPDTLLTFRECALEIVPALDFDALVMDSTNTVFCNYFAARPGFWTAWLANCERIFAIAEAGGSDLARRLNEDTRHDGYGVPTKVFMLERVASLMLATDKRWKVKACNPLSLPWSGSPLAQFQLEMALLDALKIAHRSAGHPEYMGAFHRLRTMVNQSLQGSPTKT